MIDGSALLRLATIPASGSGTGVAVQLTTHQPTLAIWLASLESALVACVLSWLCTQETIRRSIAHIPEIIKAREEARALRRLVNAATSGPHRTPQDAKAKRKDAAALIDKLERTPLGEAMRITRNSERENAGPGKTRSRTRTKASNVTDLKEHRSMSQDSDGSAATP